MYEIQMAIKIVADLNVNKAQCRLCKLQKTGWTNHSAFQSGHSLVWSDLILSGVVWSGHKGIQPLGRLGDWLDQTAEGIDWSGIFFTYGFDHLDTSVKNHFLVYKAIFAWSQTPNEQLTNQPGEPRASLLLTSVSEKAVFCNYDLSTAIVCINYSYWCVGGKYGKIYQMCLCWFIRIYCLSQMTI